LQPLEVLVAAATAAAAAAAAVVVFKGKRIRRIRRKKEMK